MIQPRARRDLGLQRPRHDLRQLRQVQPGGELAAARRVVGSQPARRRHRRALRRQRRALRHRRRSASSSGKLFVDDLTPRTIDEFLVGTARQFNSRWTGRALRPLPRGQPLLGGHEQQRARRVQPARRHPARARTFRTSRSSWRRSAGGSRRYVIAELDGAYTKYYEVTLEAEWRDAQGVRARVVHLEPLLRQLRPGQLGVDQRRQRLHRLVEHRRRRRAASSGTSATATCAATGRTCSSSTATTSLHVERDRRRLSSSRSPASRGSRGATSRTCADDQHERHGAVRRAGRLAPHRRHWQLDLNYTQNFRLTDALQRCSSRRPVQRRQQADRLQLPAERPRLATFGTAARLLRPAAVPARVQIQF